VVVALTFKRIRMNWTEILKILGITSISFAGIAALIAFLIKTIFKSLIDKDLENFKAQLQLSVNEHQIQFSTLHVERANVIKELYMELADTMKTMEAFVRDHSGKLDSQQRKGALEQLGRLRDFITRHKVYFDDQICSLLDKLVSILNSVDFSKFFADDLKTSANLTGNLEDAKEAGKIRKETWDNFYKTIPQLEDELRKRFQNLLGVQSSV